MPSNSYLPSKNVLLKVGVAVVAVSLIYWFLNRRRHHHHAWSGPPSMAPLILGPIGPIPSAPEPYAPFVTDGGDDGGDEDYAEYIPPEDEETYVDAADVFDKPEFKNELI